MLLQALSERSGVSVASIKYYRREGLLPSGRRITATRAAYDESHLDRLRLIGALRDIAELPIATIGRITALLDSPDTPLWMVLREVQAAILMPAAPPVEAARHPYVDAVLVDRGWPDVPTAALAVLNGHLTWMDRAGVAPARATVLAYAEALDRVAAVDVGAVRDAPSRDEATRIAAVGMVAHRRLVECLLALAQASRALGEGGEWVSGPDGSR